MQSDKAFHAGEMAVQARAGVGPRVAEIGRRLVRDHLTEQHQLFFAMLPFVLVGSVDRHGRPWASMLAGPPGFMRAATPRQLVVGATPLAGDPLVDGLTDGSPLGLLGIELHSRRRNRVNGRVEGLNEYGFALAVDQAFGNCPQYIVRRAQVEMPASAPSQAPVRELLARLDAEALALITRSDAFFVASHSGGANASTRGADVSHRGGAPGFVRVEADGALLVPDYSGNNFYMTLGNFSLDARAGLLFIDFDRGDLLFLTGRVEMLWDQRMLSGLDGAQRAWRFRTDAGVRLRAACALRWQTMP